MKYERKYNPDREARIGNIRQFFADNYTDNNPIKLGHYALIACIFNGELTIDDALREMNMTPYAN